MPNLHISISASWQYGDYAPGEDPNAALETAIDILGAKISDLSETWTKVADEVLQPAVAEQIESEGRFMGTPWEKLSKFTAKDRVKRGFGDYHPMLVRDGDLKRSFLTGGDDHVQKISPTEMEWGSALPKSLFLHTGTQEGYSIGRSNLGKLGLAIMKLHGARAVGMPGRPLFRMTPEVVEGINEQFRQAVIAAMGDAGIAADGIGS